ncbi:hypothetical protein TNCV_1550161 [Trichonephila clavipes]|uniref:Uncharacterized protein n=1 Tax=Trichonephila clavipes TaxID=2585209 RepID=A0A8X6RUJ4_TRICX|nr:hypothetical protein TNCV_1550161 [Trichonephila clavipes]
MNYYNANNEDDINVKNNKGLDQISDSPEADLKRLFNPAMVVEDTVPKQTSEPWEDLTQLLDKFPPPTLTGPRPAGKMRRSSSSQYSFITLSSYII